MNMQEKVAVVEKVDVIEKVGVPLDKTKVFALDKPITSLPLTRVTVISIDSQFNADDQRRSTMLQHVVPLYVAEALIGEDAEPQYPSNHHFTDFEGHWLGDLKDPKVLVLDNPAATLHPNAKLKYVEELAKVVANALKHEHQQIVIFTVCPYIIEGLYRALDKNVGSDGLSYLLIKDGELVTEHALSSAFEGFAEPVFYWQEQDAIDLRDE